MINTINYNEYKLMGDPELMKQRDEFITEIYTEYYNKLKLSQKEYKVLLWVLSELCEPIGQLPLYQFDRESIKYALDTLAQGSKLKLNRRKSGDIMRYFKTEEASTTWDIHKGNVKEFCNMTISFSEAIDSVYNPFLKKMNVDEWGIFNERN